MHIKANEACRVTKEALSKYNGAQKKCIHTLIEVIYGCNHKIKPKCNVWCVV
jgi:hypothetical protein